MMILIVWTNNQPRRSQQSPLAFLFVVLQWQNIFAWRFPLNFQPTMSWWRTRSLGEWIAFFIFTDFALFILLLRKERTLLFTLVSGKGQNWTEIRSSPGHYFGDWCFKGLYKISRLGVNWTLTVLGKGAAWTTAARHLHIYNAKNMSIPPWYW